MASSHEATPQIVSIFLLFFGLFVFRITTFFFFFFFFKKAVLISCGIEGGTRVSETKWHRVVGYMPCPNRA